MNYLLNVRFRSIGPQTPKKKGGDRTTPELPPEGIAIPFPTNVSIFCL